MILFGLEEFTSRRRGAQARIEDALRPIVTRALDGKINTDGYGELIGEVRDQWHTAYIAEAGHKAKGIPRGFLADIRDVLAKTDRPRSDATTVDRITIWLATAILSHSTLTATTGDEEFLLLEWVDMGDTKVRHAHHEANGQSVEPGEPFSVGGYKMPYPGYPGVPIELWINCRCTVRPKLANEEAMVASDGYDGVTHAGLAVQASDTGRILMQQRTLDPTDPPDVQGTWEFPGGGLEDGEEPYAAACREFCEETGLAVPEGEVTGGWRSTNGVYQAFVLTVDLERGAFGELNPDLAAAENINPDDPERESPDVVAWFSVEQIKSLGAALRPEVAADTDWSQFSVGGGDVWHADAQPKEDDMTTSAPEAPAPEQAARAETVPWHGVLAPEAIKSGDGRGFRDGALRNRPLPLPLTWQKISADGHGQAVVVARIDRIERVNGEARGEGVMLATPEANDVISLIGEFGRFGVSVDADDVTMEADPDSEEMWFSDARISGACIVPIPAFSQAWVGLGAAPEDFFDGGTPLEAAGVEAPDEALVAATAPLMAEVFVDVAPGVTEDGPGWLTHPIDTDRLRDYWVRGEGAAKIGWGAPGDFKRCETNLAPYVKPEYLAGYCANRHKDALGVWPGQEATAADTLGATEDMAEPLNLVASTYGNLKAPHAWFNMPEADKVTPLTITEDGQVYGHVADWKSCHNNTSAYGECTLAPHSPTGYANFLLGEVLTTEGRVDTGCLTIGGGHAGGRLGLRAAQAHYDNTTAVFADVNCWDGEHGIWVCGWVRPGTPEEMVVAARGSKLSGDWRHTAKGLDMIAALAVNSPGFTIPRIAAHISNGETMSLVAAGVVADETPPAEVDIAALAAAVVTEIAALNARKQEMAALAARYATEGV